METSSIDDAKELLYGNPVESFIAERDVLVKAIRADGNRELANEVKALRRPSAVAAVVNQVVRSDPAGVDLILQAAALLRSAQAGALEGSGINASELQQQYRAAVGALAQSATERHAEVRAALEAATIDEASNEALRAGCLVTVPTPISIFGAAPAASADAAEATPTGPTTEAKPPAEQPVDELEERRARRQADKQAKAEAADESAREKVMAAAKAAAKEAAAAEKKAAAEAERQRKAAEKERKKQLKELQKQHREALRAHLAALDEEEAVSVAVEEADQQLLDTDDEIEAAEQALADLRERRDLSAAERDRIAATQADAHERAEQAQAAVDALADAVAALEEPS